MKFLIDENVGGSIIRYLRSESHDVVCVAEIGLGMNDKNILELALRDHRIVLTYDTDFGDLVFRDRKPHGGIILVRFHIDDVRYHLAALKNLLKKHSEEEIKKSFWKLDEGYVEEIFNP